MKKLLFLLMFVPLSVFAVPEGRVRISVDEDHQWWVGQRVLVHLDLLTNGFSFSGQQFELPQLSGAVLLQTDSSTTKLSENIDGESWQVLRYELSLFGQRAGEVEVPAFAVRFAASTGYGQPSAEFELSTQAIRVDLQMPPGVDPAQPVISSPRLVISEQWAPDQDEFKVGDSLTRTVTIEAEDVSALVLPDPPQVQMEGVDLLARPAQVKDHTNRGSLSGKRQSQLTYLFTQAGDYSLPGGSLSWWNPARTKLETFDYEARQVLVKPDPTAPVHSQASDTKPSGFTIRAVIIVLVVLLLLAALAFALWPRRQQPGESEPIRFKNAVRACNAHDPKCAWREVNAWLSLTGLEITTEDREAWEELQRAVVGDGQEWSGHALTTIINRIRKQYLVKQGEENQPLPPLNPGS